ncbi:MAG: hypothetical protein ACOVS5_18910 [Oligoflexus sp.]|jgi:hypothetical protein
MLNSSLKPIFGLFGALLASSMLGSYAMAATEAAPVVTCKSEGLDRLKNKIEFVLEVPVNPDGTYDISKPVLDLRVTKVGESSPRLVLDNLPLLTSQSSASKITYVGEFFEGLEVSFLGSFAFFRYEYTVVSPDPNVENRVIVTKELYKSGVVNCVRT